MSSTDAHRPRSRCDLCGSVELRPVYQVPGSPRGMTVDSCPVCGLLQSRPTRVPAEQRLRPSLSAGPTFGNIRHGKGLRLAATAPLMAAQVNWSDVRSVLDVGSNRGAFLRWVSAHKPGLRLVAVEPDESLVEPYADLAGLQLHVGRLEDVELPPATFDFVHCAHTLEHAESAAAMLERIVSLMRPGGLLFLEVPAVSALGREDVVEEFFIDKHRYHFTHEVLCAALARLGLRRIHGPVPGDAFHVTLLLEKNGAGSDPGPGSAADALAADALAADALAADALVADYARRLAANRARLPAVAARLEDFAARQRLVYWGAGRILDALVSHGGLDPGHAAGLVDGHLAGLVPEVAGLSVQRPEVLRTLCPDVVVALASSSTAVIAEHARRLGVRHVIPFASLLADA